MKIVGIDIGTTSICGVVLDGESGRVDCSKTINSDAFIPTENEWEKIQNVEKIVTIATGILDSFLDDYKGEVAAIGLTGQMHGIVYVNAQGRAVSPLYTWQDARGDLPYRGTTYAKHLGSFAGYGNVTDFYNRENGLVPKDAVGYCTIHDYLGMVLCGNRAPVMHASNAASLGLYDLAQKKFCYDNPVKVTDAFEIIGAYRQIPVSVAIGDNQASVFSTLANEDHLLINVGTGSQISIVSDQPIWRTGLSADPTWTENILLLERHFAVAEPIRFSRTFTRSYWRRRERPMRRFTASWKKCLRSKPKRRFGSIRDLPAQEAMPQSGEASPTSVPIT